MIRYSISREALEKLINDESGTWLSEAQKKKGRFKALKKYQETEGEATWSEIKAVYMTLQRGKCAYCERKFGQDAESKIEHDVEHFRPKSKVRSWPTKKIKDALKLNYSFTTGDSSVVGYYLLAYDPFNYIVSCKKCNTIYKSDYFPIAGPVRFCDDDHPKKLAKEKAFLIYPLGSLDNDPEDLITFQGIIPVPKHSQGHKHQRAMVTIDFFKLAVGRDELLRERAVILKALYWAIDDLKTTNDPVRKAAAQQTVDLALSPANPHTSCARSFYQLCQTDPETARQFYQAISEYLATKGF